MVSDKPKKPSKTKTKFSKPHNSATHKRKPKNPKPNKTIAAKKKKNDEEQEEGQSVATLISTEPSDFQLKFFLGSFQKGTKTKLSPLELETYNERCMAQLEEGEEQNVEKLSEHVKIVFGEEWDRELCEGKLLEGDDVASGSPALLVICTSALRSLELLRGLREFTKDCRAAKLFAKHLKVEEQVLFLKERVNVACGTPSRIKKLLDMEALSLSRLKLVVLDMQKDSKAFSLFTLPQVSTEFWDLYKSHIEEKVTKNETRICFYGAVPNKEINKAFKSEE
ncbi:hypothetical protein LUZ60_004797 [Juncus effusus]|nr:hypothetical protein LUZ60_004797 [Juncus effusus]